jgi:OOP family OmpA-OmpF porin
MSNKKLMFWRQTLIQLLAGLVVSLYLSTNVVAQTNPFSPGWQLNSGASAVKFQSLKNSTKVETSSFATMSGAIDESGAATLNILLDSVDTKVDLRNVRMRFLFFETFKFPEAIVSMQLDQSVMSDLAEVRRKILTLPYTIDLHGFTQTLETEVALTLISEDLISVSSSTPITLSVGDFGLAGGIKKLEEAANVSILPSTTITFDLLFARSTGDTVAASSSSNNAPSAALETEGDFSLEACVGRFEILSRTDNIYFKLGSAELDPESQLILNSIADIVRRCPGLVIEVSGHTDSDGSAQGNQVLSEARANAVRNYLKSVSIKGDRVVTIGHGANKPVVPNNSAENKQRNRRIEFAVVNN